ncbi:uncharacterized protein MYCFIDRAFT_204519, partial [Pseudocercospora fijiensis CIRAD86]
MMVRQTQALTSIATVTTPPMMMMLPKQLLACQRMQRMMKRTTEMMSLKICTVWLMGTLATSAHDTNRLNTLTRRRNRHVSPPRNFSPLSSTMPSLAGIGRARSGQANASASCNERSGYFSSMFPRHPFQLSSTLDRINRTLAANAARSDSNRGSQSSTGGVALRGSSSGSGSSRTVRAGSEEDVAARRRRLPRRRIHMADLDESDG